MTSIRKLQVRMEVCTVFVSVRLCARVRIYTCVYIEMAENVADLVQFS